MVLRQLELNWQDESYHLFQVHVDQWKWVWLQILVEVKWVWLDIQCRRGPRRELEEVKVSSLSPDHLQKHEKADVVTLLIPYTMTCAHHIHTSWQWLSGVAIGFF